MLDFPAMKKLCMVPLLLLLTGCRQGAQEIARHHNNHMLIAVRDIPAGTVLQHSDLKLDHGWTLHGEDSDCLSDPENVLGHKTLRPLVKGETVHVTDIEGIEGWAVSNHIPNPCPERVADGWDGYRQTGHP
jgi:flagella basal body P-ring formation protein FlgA